MDDMTNKNFFNSVLKQIQERHQSQLRSSQVSELSGHARNRSLSNNGEASGLINIDTSHLYSEKIQLKQMLSPSDSFEQDQQSYSDEGEGGQQEKRMRYQKKKLAKLLLKMILEKQLVSRNELFIAFSEFYTQEGSLNLTDKNRKRRFDEILSVLKASKIIKQEKKIISPLRMKEQLTKSQRKYPQKLQEMIQRQQAKRFELDQLQKKKRALGEHCRRMEGKQINQNFKIPLVCSTMGIVYENGSIKGQNWQEKQTKTQPGHHNLKITGRFDATMEFLTLLGVLYKPYFDRQR